MYSLGAPRVCLEPFASNVNSLGLLRGAGKSLFRIVNHNDPITTVPPVKKDQLAEYPFVHVGGAWEIFGDRNPIRMSDEPPPVDPKPIKGNWWTWRIKDHSESLSS